MSHYGAFWCCRCSRCVHDDAWIFGSELDVAGQLVGFKQRLERRDGIGDGFDRIDLDLTMVFYGLERFCIIGVLNDEDVGLDGLEDGVQAVRLEPGIDRDDDAADLYQCPVDEEVVDGVGKADGDDRAWIARDVLEFGRQVVADGIGFLIV